MPSKNSITKTIRIKGEDVDIIEGIMKREGLSWSGAISWVIGRGTPLNSERGTPLSKKTEKPSNETKLRGVHPYIKEKTLKDIELMCNLSGIETARFFDEICRLFNEGGIEISGDRVEIKGKYDLSELESACKEHNLKIEEVIKKTITRIV